MKPKIEQTRGSEPFNTKSFEKSPEGNINNQKLKLNKDLNSELGSKSIMEKPSFAETVEIMKDINRSSRETVENPYNNFSNNKIGRIKQEKTLS
jgi:hypothetical protein